MKNILVSTTFSENCTHAVDLGIKLAKHHNAEIHFFHFIKTPVDWLEISKTKEDKYPETLKQIVDANSKLKDYELMAENEHLKCKTFIEFDASPENIMQHSNNFHHDFIVTGSETKGNTHEPIKSYIELIVRKAKVPVLIVEKSHIVFPFKNIVFISNFVNDVGDALNKVVSIATQCHAKIHLLQIIPETDLKNSTRGLNPVDQLLQKFPKFKNYTLTVYNEPSLEHGITTFIKQHPVDLIAMVTHGKMGFLSLFPKSITENVTNNLPIMTINV
ncbi:universal stress protein [Mariniflexile sp.]|uniref:universal stress protein n=3 Tax=Mariniflexile sp. TaxID=1979402 RepID=UPI0040472018